MMNIIFAKTDFDQAWAADTLMDILHANSEVCILPLSRDTGWASDQQVWQEQFAVESEYYEDVLRPFLQYGIPRDNIKVLNHLNQSETYIVERIHTVDVFVMVGDNAHEAMYCLEEIPEVMQAIQNHSCILMGIGDVGSCFGETYRTNQDSYVTEEEGLGLLEGFHIYMETGILEEDLHTIIDWLETDGQSVVVIGPKGGILIDMMSYEILGNTTIYTADDLDELYEKYHFECGIEW